MKITITLNPTETAAVAKFANKTQNIVDLITEAKDPKPVNIYADEEETGKWGTASAHISEEDGTDIQVSVKSGLFEDILDMCSDCATLIVPIVTGILGMAKLLAGKFEAISKKWFEEDDDQN